MIRKIRHKGLRLLHEKRDSSKVHPDHVEKLRRILARLEVSRSAEDMRLPGYHLHSLAGNYAGFYSVHVSGNWRVIFRFDENDVTDVDYQDYH